MKLDRRTLLVGGAALGGASTAFAETRNIGGGRGHARALSELARYVEQHRTDWGLPGMTVCAVDRDGYSGFITSGYANLERRTPVNADHVFQVGSITKMIVALAAYQMMQEGKLRADAKLSALMPELNVRDGGDITLQHLLNHTSGLPADAPVIGEAGLWSGYAPGSHWSYSNTGYDIIGLILERTDNALLAEILERRVLRPLAMNASYGAIRTGDRLRYAQGYESLNNERLPFRPGPMAQASWVDVDRGAGCVASTVGDMAKFLRYLLTLAAGEGAPVLSNEYAQRFLAAAADAPGWADGAKYGNGIARVTSDERLYLHHTGGMVSFCSALHVDAAAGVAVWASTNTSYMQLSYRPRAITLQGCRLLASARGGPAVLPAAPTRARLEHPEVFVNTYTAADGDNFEIVADGDQIKMRREGRVSDMQPVGPYFACREPKFELLGLMFEIDKDKAVRAWSFDVEYLAAGQSGYKPAAPAALRALAGRYDNDDRWLSPTYVVARDGKLLMNNSDVLVALPDGAYRIGEDDWSPERVRFDGVINGRPTRMLISGVPFVRRFS
ncbi:serine hydrolase domain-containing protein [Terricaulis sp.]|uniref:serine hydrolase domain-containing protein n=1 Tax=Terricaulis sp. TaxID=2768686 RepID=UPI003783D38F